MKERPILFSGEMVRAILEGRKSQTRRVVKFAGSGVWRGLTGQLLAHQEFAVAYPAKENGFVFWDHDRSGLEQFTKEQYTTGHRCPYGVPGDRLWVLETWAIAKEYNHLPGSKIPEFSRSLLKIWRLADGPKPEWAGRTRSSRFMPRWASRIMLEVVNVRVERVQEISERDAWAEGITVHAFGARAARYTYEDLWNEINAERGYGWSVNPWVWVVEFAPLVSPHFLGNENGGKERGAEV